MDTTRRIFWGCFIQIGISWCESAKTLLAFPKKNHQEGCLINKTSNLLRTAEEKADKISNYLHHKQQY